MTKTNDDRDELIFDLIKKRLEDESTRSSTLDGKTNNLIGFVSVVVGLLLGTGTFTLSTLASNLSYSIPFFLSIGLLLGSIILGLFAFRVRKWIVVPNVRNLLRDYTDQPYSEVLKRNAGEMANAVADTEKKNDDKAHLINWSWYLLIAGLAIMLIFLLIYANGVASDQIKNPLLSNSTQQKLTSS